METVDESKNRAAKSILVISKSFLYWNKTKGDILTMLIQVDFDSLFLKGKMTHFEVQFNYMPLSRESISI